MSNTLSKEETLKKSYEYHKNVVKPDDNWASWEDCVKDGTVQLCLDAMEDYSQQQLSSLRKALERAIGIIETECDDQNLINELNAVLNSTPTPVEQDDQNKLWKEAGKIIMEGYDDSNEEIVLAQLKQLYHISKL